MRNMFRLATGLTGGFNQDISSWDTGKVIYMNYMFAYNTVFNQPLNSWDVSQVKEMTSMFRQCSLFNQPLNNWNTGNVMDFTVMFNLAIAFNQPLNSWNTRNATNIEYMFHSAYSFNQNIGNWDIRKVTSFAYFMALKTFSNYSSDNYNALLNGWSSQDVLAGRTIHFNTIKYTAAGQNGRNILTSLKGWTIQDGGITL